MQTKMQSVGKLIMVASLIKSDQLDRRPRRRAGHIIGAIGVLILAACVLGGCAANGPAAPVAPAAASSTSAASDFNKASSLAGANHCGRAVPLFLSAIAKDGPAINAYMGLASCYAILGSPNKGLRVFDNAIALDPTNFGLYNSRALAEASLGDTGAAAMDAQTALRFAPNQVPSYVSVSTTFTDFGDFADAVTALDKAIALVPNDPSLYEQRASIYLNNMGDAARAFADYRRAIQVAPFIAARAVIYSDLASVYASQSVQDYDSAYRSIKTAISLDTSNAAYYVKSGDIHRAGGAFDAALHLYNQALALTTLGTSALNAYQGKGAIYVATNDKKDALLAYEAALRLASDTGTRTTLRTTIKTLKSGK